MRSESEKVRIGIVRVLTTKNSDILESHGKLIKEYLKDQNLEVISLCIDGFPEGIHTEEDEIRAIPNIIKTGKQLVDKFNVNSVIVSCAVDPGIKELRDKLTVPVIGAGSAAATVAWILGGPVGALGITDTPPKIIKDILKDRLVAYKKPEAVKTTLDISKVIPEYINSARLLVQKGAKIIILACTGLSTVRMAKYIEDELHVTVVDPVISAGILAYYAAKGNA